MYACKLTCIINRLQQHHCQSNTVETQHNMMIHLCATRADYAIVTVLLTVKTNQWCGKTLRQTWQVFENRHWKLPVLVLIHRSSTEHYSKSELQPNREQTFTQPIELSSLSHTLTSVSCLSKGSASGDN